MQDGRCHGDAGCQDRPDPSQPIGPCKQGPADFLKWLGRRQGRRLVGTSSWQILASRFTRLRPVKGRGGGSEGLAPAAGAPWTPGGPRGPAESGPPLPPTKEK